MLKEFPDNVEIEKAGLAAECEEKFRFMNGRESCFIFLSIKRVNDDGSIKADKGPCNTPCFNNSLHNNLKYAGP